MKQKNHKNAVFEVQTYTFCQGWINCWTVDDQPQYFPTEQAAQAEIIEFLSDIDAEIVAGRRQPDEGYSSEDFRVRQVR